MITKINLYKQSLHSDDHMVVATPVNYNPKSQRILVSVNNKVAEADYNPQTKNVTAKLVVLQNNANHPLESQLPKNADMRVKVFVYDFLKDRILGAKLQEFTYSKPTLNYKPSDELLSTSPVIVGNWDKRGLVEKAKEDEKIEKILIKKIEGPENIFEEKEYEFKIVEWSKKEVKLNELIPKIKWGYTVDAGKLVYITTKALIDKKNNQIILKWKVPKVEGAKIAVYAWLEQRSEGVKVVCNLKSDTFPMLIIRSVARKGKKTIIVNGKKVSTQETALDLLFNDYTQDDVGYKKLKKQIYDETFLNEKQDSLLDILSREENAETKSTNIVDNIKKFSKKSNKKLFEIFIDKAENLSRGVLEENIKIMIRKMQNNEGGEYSNINLTNAVIEHENNLTFVSSVKKWTNFFFKKYKNNVEFLQIKDDSEGLIYNSNFKNEVDKPRFGGKLYTLSGLQIAINDVWSYEIYLNKYKVEKNEPHGELQFIFFDHFGLDYPDIQKYDQDIFIAWFVLQHFRGFKPFITKISFTIKF